MHLNLSCIIYSLEETKGNKLTSICCEFEKQYWACHIHMTTSLKSDLFINWTLFFLFCEEKRAFSYIS